MSLGDGDFHPNAYAEGSAVIARKNACLSAAMLKVLELWEDVLARRTRALLLGARASIEAAPRVAELMARELKRDGNWQKQSVQNFNQVAQGYVLPA